MNWNGTPNHKATPLACAAVSHNSNSSCCNPSFAAIGSYSPNPKVRVNSRLFSLHIGRVALLAAKAQAGLTFVLTLNPWLHFKASGTFCAIVHFTLNRIHSLGLFAGKRIGWAQASAPFISYFMGVRHSAIGHVPFPATSLTAKTRSACPVVFNLKRGITHFAYFGNHAVILPQFMGTGSTGVPCERIERAYAQPRLFEDAKFGAGETAVQGDMLLPTNANQPPKGDSKSGN